MVEIPVVLRDIQVLLAAEMSLSQWLAEYVAGLLDFPEGTLEKFSAVLIDSDDWENTLFFECTIDRKKYAAYLLIRNGIPVLTAELLVYTLHKLKRTFRYHEYKELKCCLVAPENLLKKDPGASTYPITVRWEQLATVLKVRGGARGRYIAEMMLRALVGAKPLYVCMRDGLVVDCE